MSVLATNHAGWNVEELRGPEGWVAFIGPFEDKYFTVRYCEGLQSIMPAKEFRVYEALTTKEKK